MSLSCLKVAVPSPLRRLFDYLPAKDQIALPGMRVRVPFGRVHQIGVVLEVGVQSEVPVERLKEISRVIDREPLLGSDDLSLLRWAATYYHHPLGAVMQAALPVALREAGPARLAWKEAWQLTGPGRALDLRSLDRAPRQRALLEIVRATAGRRCGADTLAREGRGWRVPLRRLLEKGLLEAVPSLARGVIQGRASATPPSLNSEQRQALDDLIAAGDGFHPFLLEGITGSGKTEVYLRAIEPVLRAGRRVLVLVPEIGLTPQLLERFSGRLDARIAVLHSGLAEGERSDAWLAARAGQAEVIIGTRSAVFTPLPDLGLIIVDEEHDASFKQQDGFRYSARDVAVMRARQCGVPVLLGSATPSLESLHNAGEGRYGLLRLGRRAGGARPPVSRMVDLDHTVVDQGLSRPLAQAMQQRLDQGEQVLLFLNRRGYAPVLLCGDCGWMADCTRCDAHLTLHQAANRLRCHHCGNEQPRPSRCPACGGQRLVAVGQGTERIEQVLTERFPGVDLLRVDRDSTRRKGSLEGLLERIHQGRPALLVGTQMLAKGHHFPAVTLAAILNADSGLYSADFRAPERLGQLLVQVAGRAGREQRRGEVWIQTRNPDHPWLQLLLQRGYSALAAQLLEERRQADLPPFSHQALLRARGPDRGQVMAFLERVKPLFVQHAGGVDVLGPAIAPMERRAGRFHAQILLQAPRRADLQVLLGTALPQLEKLRPAKGLHWSLDVDPADLY